MKLRDNATPDTSGEEGEFRGREITIGILRYQSARACNNEHQSFEVGLQAEAEE
jgi:hypothetical protein